MWYAIGALVLVVVAFLVWRITSVGRGVRRCEEKLMRVLEPLGAKLADGIPVAREEVDALCRRYELRPMLYNMLKHFEKLELFGNEYTSLEGQAEGLLAQWMMHPNELQAPPESMACLRRVLREIDGRQATFIVMKYVMPSGHWAGDDWLLGLSGPFFETDVPYGGVAGAFSRCSDKLGSIEPDELVDWFVGMCYRKSGQATPAARA